MNSIYGISPTLDTYLAELYDATAKLPRDERFEIRTSIEDHLRDLVNGRRQLNDDEAQRIIDHLGPVSEITAMIPMSIEATHVIPIDAPHKNSPAPAQSRPDERGYSRLALVMAGATVIAFVLMPPLSVVLGLVAVIFGALGLRAGERRAESWAGVLIGPLPLMLAVFWATLGLTLSGGSASLFG